MTNAQCAKFIGVSESRFYQLRQADAIPDDLLSPVPGLWSREKVARWMAEGSPALRVRKHRRGRHAA